ncbi:uncharacterized protein MONOS_3949 [Monocercomonoides exilis]|uniref:uncharacterized protein n=1 Tax=Monocercomonoides exilis TaxID=2049356 RepID=UPI003559CD33|nr:hypothetical protein MONOS_3949 [Monocercomonoides exilis]|eukprot:MONOS_3949.1-p1 / transcript=MONOS_3949.1 / gene=MONOS_3949 / organism=Monocercomonoides_exilis_PA203 / gene_product=unspecified product / transcript_product=unspecified product / location=Mono_scaffold00098:107246-109135(+) / protein_length=496 / sequence_SO=supercontig / SO=protein_coding / is_pseudo=false
MRATKASSMAIRIFAIILAILFVFLTVLGIIFAAMFKGAFMVGAAVIIFGLIGLAISIFGIIGASFGRNRNPKLALCLSIFFAGIATLFVVLLIVGLMCICMQPTVHYAIAFSANELKVIFGKLPNNFSENIAGFLNSVARSLNVLAIICFVISGVLLFACIITGVQLGLPFFLKTLIFFGCIILVIISIILIAVAAFFFRPSRASENKAVLPSGLFSLLIVFAVILLLSAILGLVSTLLKHKKRLLLWILLVANSVIALSFFVLFIVSLSIKGAFFNKVEDTCRANSAECKSLLGWLQKNECMDKKTETEKQKCINSITVERVIILMEDALGGWLMIAGIVSLIIFCILLLMVLATLLHLKKPELFATPSKPILPGHISTQTTIPETEYEAKASVYKMQSSKADKRHPSMSLNSSSQQNSTQTRELLLNEEVTDISDDVVSDSNSSTSRSLLQNESKSSNSSTSFSSPLLSDTSEVYTSASLSSSSAREEGEATI